MVSWSDDKELSSWADIISWNSLKKKKILSDSTTYFNLRPIGYNMPFNPTYGCPQRDIKKISLHKVEIRLYM